MPGPSIPKPIAGLIGKIAVRGTGGDKPLSKGGSGEATGMRGDGLAAGPGLGAPIGPDGQLRAGLGYTLRDRHTALRNLVEKANVEQFISDMESRAGAARGKGLGASKEGDKAPERPQAARDSTEARETRGKDEGRAEIRDEGRREDVVREHHAEANRTESESREARSERERDRSEGDGQGRDESEDEEDRPGAGWVLEEAEEREKRRRFQIDAADPLGSANRCRAHLHDGSRCLRKPMDGTPYCAEHRYT